MIVAQHWIETAAQLRSTGARESAQGGDWAERTPFPDCQIHTLIDNTFLLALIEDRPGRFRHVIGESLMVDQLKEVSGRTDQCIEVGEVVTNPRGM